MTGSLVYRPIDNVGAALVVLDATHRLYAGLNHAGNGWHVIQPARRDDPRVGDGKVRAGDLYCTCEAGTFGRRCYRLDQAAAFEAGQIRSIDLTDIFADAAPGELVEAYGK